MTVNLACSVIRMTCDVNQVVFSRVTYDIASADIGSNVCDEWVNVGDWVCRAAENPQNNM